MEQLLRVVTFTPLACSAGGVDFGNATSVLAAINAANGLQSTVEDQPAPPTEAELDVIRLEEELAELDRQILELETNIGLLAKDAGTFLRASFDGTDEGTKLSASGNHLVISNPVLVLPDGTERVLDVGGLQTPRTGNELGMRLAGGWQGFVKQSVAWSFKFPLRIRQRDRDAKQIELDEARALVAQQAEIIPLINLANQVSSKNPALTGDIFRGVLQDGSTLVASAAISGSRDTATGTAINSNSARLSAALRKPVSDDLSVGAGASLSAANSAGGTDATSTITFGLVGFFDQKINGGHSVQGSLSFSNVWANTARASGTITGNYTQQVASAAIGITSRAFPVGDGEVKLNANHVQTVSSRGAYTESDATVNAASTTAIGQTTVQAKFQMPADIGILGPGQAYGSVGAMWLNTGGTGQARVPVKLGFRAAKDGHNIDLSVGATLGSTYLGWTLSGIYSWRF